MADKTNRRGDAADDVFDDDDGMLIEDADDGDDDADLASGGKPGTRTAVRQTKIVPAPAKVRRERGPGPLARLIRFIREIVAELAKVIWPTRKELVTYTSVVVVFVAIMLTVVGGLDVGFAKLMVFVFGKG